MKPVEAASLLAISPGSVTGWAAFSGLERLTSGRWLTDRDMEPGPRARMLRDRLDALLRKHDPAAIVLHVPKKPVSLHAALSGIVHLVADDASIPVAPMRPDRMRALVPEAAAENRWERVTAELWPGHGPDVVESAASLFGLALVRQVGRLGSVEKAVNTLIGIFEPDDEIDLVDGEEGQVPYSRFQTQVVARQRLQRQLEDVSAACTCGAARRSA